jgi:hypothetical protein
MRWRYAEAQATALLNDGFAVLDRRRLQAGPQQQRLVRLERRPRRQRRALPLVARFTTTAGTLRFAIDSTTGLDDGALDSFHGSRRVTQLLQGRAVPPLARVTQAERRELRLAVSSAAGSEPAIESGSVRDALRTAPAAPRRATSTGPLSRSWLHTFRSFTTPRSLFDCVVDRFGKPLRRFNALAPLDAGQRLAAQRDRVLHARAGLLRARLVSAALRERLSRQRAVYRLLRDSGAGAPKRARGAPCRRLPQPVGRAAAQGPLGDAVDQVGEALRRSSVIPSRTRPRCARCWRSEHEVGVAGV